jgi:hypothetical protein
VSNAEATSCSPEKPLTQNRKLASQNTTIDMAAETHKANSCTYTTLVSGDSEFVKTVGIPLAEALESELSPSGIHQNVDEVDQRVGLRKPIQIQNSFLIGGIVGVLLFVVARMGGKVVDEIYAVKIQPIIKRVLGASDRKLGNANVRSRKLFQLGVWYARERVLVMVVVFGRSFEEILSHHDLLATVHANALAWIDANGRCKSVHLYVVEAGQVNAAPVLFDTLMDANAHIAGWPSASAPTLSNGS